MDKIINDLTAWGCDTINGLARAVDDEKLYLRCCKMLSADKGFESLGKALKKGDVTASFEEAHSLKGVCGNMGLTPIYMPMMELSSILRNGRLDGTEEVYAIIMQAYKKFCEIVK